MLSLTQIGQITDIQLLLDRRTDPINHHEVLPHRSRSALRLLNTGSQVRSRNHLPLERRVRTKLHRQAVHHRQRRRRVRLRVRPRRLQPDSVVHLVVHVEERDLGGPHNNRM